MSDIQKPNGEFDLTKLIERNAEQQRERERERKTEEITLSQYIELLREDPFTAQLSSTRLKEIFDKYGFESVPDDEQIFGKTKHVNLVDKMGLFGDPAHRAAWTFYNWLGSGSPTEQMAVVFVGPTASGKTSFVDGLMNELERYRVRPIFGISTCPMREEPLHALPRFMRRSHFDVAKATSIGLNKPIEDELGIDDIEGDLCPVCRATYLGWKDGEKNHHQGEVVTEDNVFEWWNIPVSGFTFSKQAGRGIGSFEPSDEKSQDVHDLVGHDQLGVTQNKKFGYEAPGAYVLNGELEKGNRGIVEGREIFKKGIDERLLWIFINVADKKEIKVPGSSLPHISVDTIVIGHCNLTGFKEYATDQANEALHSRFIVISFGYPLRVRDEVRIYKKLLNAKGNEFRGLTKTHIPEVSLKLAALFAILTRVKESASGVDLRDKVKLYNSDIILTDLEDVEKRPMDLFDLVQEGQQHRDDLSNIDKNEGMFGIDARDVLSALNRGVAEQKGQNGCLTPMRTIRLLRDMFGHRMGYAPENVERFLSFLSAEESGSVITEYKELVVKEVSKAFLEAYEDLSREIFAKYIEEAKYHVSRKRKLVSDRDSAIRRDPVSGKPRDPDERLLRSVEEHAGVSKDQADTFRGEIVQLIGLRGGLEYDDYEPLRQAVERKILADARSSLTLVLATDKPKDEETRNRAKDLFDALCDKGYCKTCAKEMIEKASEFLNE